MAKFNPQSITVTEVGEVAEDGSSVFRFDMDDESMEYLTNLAGEANMSLEDFMLSLIKDGVLNEIKHLQDRIRILDESTLEKSSKPHVLNNPTVMLPQWIVALAQREEKSIDLSKEDIESALPYQDIGQVETFKDYFIEIFSSLKTLMPDAVAFRLAHLHIYSKGVYLPRLAQTQMTFNSDISSYELGEIFDEHAIHIDLTKIY